MLMSSFCKHYLYYNPIIWTISTKVRKSRRLNIR